ncbi:MAG: hypothetical protein HYT80_07980 [Euryarchaeota archaeon]|nr:hypothetical protein [Euryarchaeota archaeon]
MDCWKGNSRLIAVGGAYATSRSEEPAAGKLTDVVSYFCRPTAQTNSINDNRATYCGTSFAAPTVAGALSKVILGIRQQSGYTGSVKDGFVDPVRGVSIKHLRDAMNGTASYSPKSEYADNYLGVPLVTQAPWYQWGWGFFDGTIATATLAHVLGENDDRRSRVTASLDPRGCRPLIAVSALMPCGSDVVQSGPGRHPFLRHSPAAHQPLSVMIYGPRHDNGQGSKAFGKGRREGPAAGLQPLQLAGPETNPGSPKRGPQRNSPIE